MSVDSTLKSKCAAVLTSHLYRLELFYYLCDNITENISTPRRLNVGPSFKNNGIPL